MLWTQYRNVALFTSGMMLFTHPPGKDVEDRLPVNPSPPKTVTKPHRTTPFCIYLSFDDGPSAGSALVNDLALQDSLAINVFLIGHNACSNENNRSLVQDYRNNPFVEMGNHSFSHAERKYARFFHDPAAVLADIDRSRDSLHLANGLVRLPGRNFFRLGENEKRDDRNNGREAADTLAAKGYLLFGWDIEWRRKPAKGFSRHSGEEMLAIVTNMLETHRTFLDGRIVILLHDHDLLDHEYLAQVQDFIIKARSDGRFSFDHLSRIDSL
jgi:hypothetical protein